MSIKLFFLTGNKPYQGAILHHPVAILYKIKMQWSLSEGLLQQATRVHKVLDRERNTLMRFRKGKEGHSGSQGICATTEWKLAWVEIEGRKKKSVKVIETDKFVLASCNFHSGSSLLLTQWQSHNSCGMQLGWTFPELPRVLCHRKIHRELESPLLLLWSSNKIIPPN